MEGSKHSGSLFVLLGASNLARGYCALTQHISKNISGAEFVSALGPGRGYCTQGGFLNFSYSPIGECQIMEQAKVYNKRGFRMTVLLTDIGNDIMYGVPEQFLIECIDTLIEKSLQLDAEVFVTSIHVNVYKDMGEISFKLLKAVFYPNSLVTINQADSVVKKVNHYLKEKSSQNERIHLISGLGKFCGMDKIHYSLFKSHIVWSRIANTMLQSKSTPNTSNIGLGSMAVSLFKNLTNLVTFDIFKVKRKPSEFF
tara:strand:- start:387 stop:1151 length:765 start_codon:yes stop_codon:yes gene_type:complete